jgi:Zn-dependent metalloprotease
MWNNVNTNKDEYATDAQGAEMTLDYLYTKFGRKSIDNNNFAINLMCIILPTILMPSGTERE